MVNHANPTLTNDPAHYDKYSCTTTDEHRNGSILSHGYYKLTKRIGEEEAGFHEKQVEAAFEEDGVVDATRRVDKCPGAGA